jgi:opacity protein-like surface antigen
MKKLLIALLSAAMCVAVVLPAAAQKDQRDKGTETNKGYNLLPAAGDFAIGLEAVPLRMLFHGDTETFKPQFSYGGNISAKYFLKNNQAIRFGLSINSGSKSSSFAIQDEWATVVDPLNIYATVVDWRDVRSSKYSIFGGYEWRRGYGRLQGFFGVQGVISLTNSSTHYRYGNHFSETNQDPLTVSDWSTGLPTNVAGERTLKSKEGFGFGIGALGFVGAEFFFARKMSVGCQMGLGFGYENIGQSTITTERFNTATNKTEQHTRRGVEAGRRTWSLETSVQGNFFLMFHF